MRGVGVDIEQARDLGDAHLLELDEHEHEASILVHVIEDRGDRVRGLAAQDIVEWIGRARDLGEDVGVDDGRLTAPAVRGRDPPGDREQPRRDRGSALELGEPAVHDDEHVLRGVLELIGREPARAEHAPHETEVLGIDLVEGRHEHAVLQRCDENRHCRELVHAGGKTRHENQRHPISMPRLPQTATGGVR